MRSSNKEKELQVLREAILSMIAQDGICAKISKSLPPSPAVWAIAEFSAPGKHSGLAWAFKEEDIDSSFPTDLHRHIICCGSCLRFHDGMELIVGNAEDLGKIKSHVLACDDYCTDSKSEMSALRQTEIRLLELIWNNEKFSGCFLHIVLVPAALHSNIEVSLENLLNDTPLNPNPVSAEDKVAINLAFVRLLAAELDRCRRHKMIRGFSDSQLESLYSDLNSAIERRKAELLSTVGSLTMIDNKESHDD